MVGIHTLLLILYFRKDKFLHCGTTEYYLTERCGSDRTSPFLAVDATPTVLRIHALRTYHPCSTSTV
ncbi:hypothetical protein J6590_040940 [Homalodisca vitripennis]|nr:hypothetical protein J6590_040940 [Homalodisca vitripennis]